MLVLSRKENEKILFPHLGIALQILRVGGGKVRLGVEAPSDVSVVRYEIASDEQISAFAERLKQTARDQNHAVRNRLHSTLLGLCVAQKQLALNKIEDAEQTLEHLLAQMDGLERELSKSEREAAARSRRRALVVEDNSNERGLLASYLSLSGFEVEAVEDGVKALDYLASHERPDAVVMDMQLPRLGGAEAVSVLRSDPRFRGLKVYAVSGMSKSDLHLSIGPEGVNEWFTKPLDPRKLVERINAEIEPASCGTV